MQRFFRRGNQSAAPDSRKLGAAAPVTILVALVADSGEWTRRRTARNMASVDATHDMHQAHIDWAVCTYDYGKHAWSSLQQKAASWRHSNLVLVINHNDSSERAFGRAVRLTPGQRKARMVLHRRLVRTVWDRAGRDAYAAVWLLDDDLRRGGAGSGAHKSNDCKLTDDRYYNEDHRVEGPARHCDARAP